MQSGTQLRASHETIVPRRVFRQIEATKESDWQDRIRWRLLRAETVSGGGAYSCRAGKGRVKSTRTREPALKDTSQVFRIGRPSCVHTARTE
jgi:hypothetical protein